MFYGQAGGKDLLQRRWKDLAEHVKIVCDDVDITHKLREHKVHAILFLNIPRSETFLSWAVWYWEHGQWHDETWLLFNIPEIGKASH